MDSSIVFPEPWFHPWPNTSHERLASRLDNTDPLVAEALRLATRAHRGQTRRGGEPYIGHPLRVALRTAHAYPEGAGGLSRSELVAAALLHDVVEDAPWLLDELTADFPVAVADVVLLLSKVVDGTKVDPDLY